MFTGSKLTPSHFRSHRLKSVRFSLPPFFSPQPPGEPVARARLPRCDLLSVPDGKMDKWPDLNTLLSGMWPDFHGVSLAAWEIRVGATSAHSSAEKNTHGTGWWWWKLSRYFECDLSVACSSGQCVWCRFQKSNREFCGAWMKRPASAERQRMWGVLFSLVVMERMSHGTDVSTKH